MNSYVQKEIILILNDGQKRRKLLSRYTKDCVMKGDDEYGK